jgi:hypothetical protein
MRMRHARTHALRYEFDLVDPRDGVAYRLQVFAEEGGLRITARELPPLDSSQSAVPASTSAAAAAHDNDAAAAAAAAGGSDAAASAATESEAEQQRQQQQEAMLTDTLRPTDVYEVYVGAKDVRRIDATIDPPEHVADRSLYVFPAVLSVCLSRPLLPQLLPIGRMSAAAAAAATAAGAAAAAAVADAAGRWWEVMLL